MATADNSDDKKQIMDVAKPGKSTPDSTSRPVIVGHKPMMKDPMVSSSDDDAKKDDAKPEEPSPNTKKEAHKVLKPLSDDKDQATDEEPKPETEPASDNTDTPEAEDSPADEVSINNTTPDTEITDAAVVDAVAGQADRKKQEAIDNDEALKHKEAIDKLVEQKKYFLPINQVKHRRNTRWSVAVLVLLIVGSLGFLLATDAGVIKPGFSVPINFIDDKQVSGEGDTADNAVAAPPQIKTVEYVSPSTKLTFGYPEDWKLQLPKEGQPEQVFLSPTDLADSKGIINVAFYAEKLPDETTSSSSAYTILNVSYSKLSSKVADKDVFLREMVFTTRSGTILSRLTLTNNNNLKAGDTITTLRDTFIGPDGVSPVFFSMTSLVIEDEKSGHRSLDTALKYRELAQYKEAKDILMSLTVSE